MEQRTNPPTVARLTPTQGTPAPKQKGTIRPGVHVCPWSAPGGDAVLTLVSHEGEILATVYCAADADSVDAVKEWLVDLWRILDPHPALWVE